MSDLPDCDFGDECEGELKEAHKALADIARTVEAAGGNCDGDEGIPDVTRGVSNYIDNAKEEHAALKAENEALKTDITGMGYDNAAMRRSIANLQRGRQAALDQIGIVEGYAHKLLGEKKAHNAALAASLAELRKRIAELEARDGIIYVAPVESKPKCECQRHEENGHYRTDCPHYKGVCVAHGKSNCGTCDFDKDAKWSTSAADTAKPSPEEA